MLALQLLVGRLGHGRPRSPDQANEQPLARGIDIDQQASGAFPSQAPRLTAKQRRIWEAEMAVLRRRAVLAGSMGAALWVPRVNAQADWPKGPIKFIVPFPPGGGTDPIARIIAGQAGREHRLERRGREQARCGRRDRRHGGRQVAARRPDLDGDLRQPHPEPRLHAQPDLQGLRPLQRDAGRPRAAGHRLPSRPPLQDLRRGRRRCAQAAGPGQRRHAVGQPVAPADDAHPQGERLRRQLHLLQGRRADGAGRAGRRHRHVHHHPGGGRALLPDRQAARARHHRREAAAGAAPTRRRSPNRA